RQPREHALQRRQRAVDQERVRHTEIGRGHWRVLRAQTRPVWLSRWSSIVSMVGRKRAAASYACWYATRLVISSSIDTPDCCVRAASRLCAALVWMELRLAAVCVSTPSCTTSWRYAESA